MRPVKKSIPYTPHSGECLVTSSNGSSVPAVVSRFRLKESLEVIINRSVKIQMRWTGQVYEGRAAGMDFTSDGPQLGKY